MPFKLILYVFLDTQTLVNESFEIKMRLDKNLKEKSDEIKAIKKKLYETEQYYTQSLNKSYENEIELSKVQSKINDVLS